jgi:hypothetical protein
MNKKLLTLLSLAGVSLVTAAPVETQDLSEGDFHGQLTLLSPDVEVSFIQSYDDADFSNACCGNGGCTCNGSC